MAELKIPESQLDGLKVMMSVDTDSFEQALACIDTASPIKGFNDLLANLSKELDISKEKAFSFVNVLISLHGLAQDRLILLEKLADDVTEFLSKRLSLDREAAATTRSKLEYFLRSTDSLALLSRARSVLTDNQRTFSSCRILSDIRSVYTHNPESVPSAAVILHNLKLVYWNGMDKKEFFVTLDTEDLQELRKTVERAEKKTASLKAIVEKADLGYIDFAEE